MLVSDRGATLEVGEGGKGGRGGGGLTGFLKTETGRFVILHTPIHFKFKYKSTHIIITLVFFSFSVPFCL